MNLFALCKNSSGYNVKRIPLHASIQETLENIFNEQYEMFISNHYQECPFTGDWKADDDELFIISCPDYLKDILNCTTINILDIPILNISDCDENPIKALFMNDCENNRYLIQRFTKSQILARKFSLFLDGERFNKIDEPSISIDSKLLCVIADGLIKFHNFSSMQSSFDMKEFYIEATNENIEQFFTENSDILQFENLENIKNNANQAIRKRIHNLLQSNILSQYSALEIRNKAEISAEIPGLIVIKNDKIVVPSEKKELIKLLSFLDEKLYKGVFSSKILITNSSRDSNAK